MIEFCSSSVQQTPELPTINTITDMMTIRYALRLPKRPSKKANEEENLTGKTTQ
jgi:hypothetical protein